MKKCHPERSERSVSNSTQYLCSYLPHSLAVRMLRVFQTEETSAAQFNHFLRDRQYSGDGCIVGFLHLLLQTLKIQLGQSLVYHEQQLLQFELPSNLHRDGSSLKILLIGAQEQHQRIGNDNG